MQCATFNHAMRQVWRMRHRLATPGVAQALLLQAILGISSVKSENFWEGQGRFYMQ